MIEVKLNVLCGVVLGDSRRTSSVLLAAASALLVGTTAAGFAVWRMCLKYSLPPSQLATNLLAGVAQPIETASRLIAVVQLDNGFPLMLGVATPKVARSRGDGHDGAVGWLE